MTTAEVAYWQETDPTDPLFRRCGCPSDEPCQGHPDPQRLLDEAAQEEQTALRLAVLEQRIAVLEKHVERLESR